MVGIQARLQAEARAEAKRERMLKLIVLLVAVFVIGATTYAMSRPQHHVTCSGAPTSLTGFGTCS